MAKAFENQFKILLSIFSDSKKKKKPNALQASFQKMEMWEVLNKTEKRKRK